MDLTLLTFFNQTLAHPVLDGLMLFLTYGGLALLAGLGVVLLFSQQRKVGLTILVAMAASLALTFTFQYLALRPRPDEVRLLFPTPNFPSYPSGHAAVAFAVALVLALFWQRRRWWGLSLAGASLIALSRVYLGYHFPSDIFAGAVLGVGAGAASYGLLLSPTRGRLRWLLWPQVAIVTIITQMAYLDLLPWSLLAWPLADKVLHFVLFGLVVFWLNLWLEGSALRWGRCLLPLAVLLPLSLATSEEIAQSWSPLRTSDWLDWLSDLSGMLFFWWLSRSVLRAKVTRMEERAVSDCAPKKIVRGNS
ncbi:MAG: phosphatase PAP2 family protein [Anaerolineae bacterium]|nr:phosphatase PAP2 family protein [Anaerolineae bacterium]